MERIAGRGCRFLVFGRDLGVGFLRLGDLDLPDSLRALCREVPPEVFREEISSTAIRKSGALVKTHEAQLRTSAAREPKPMGKQLSSNCNCSRASRFLRLFDEAFSFQLQDGIGRTVEPLLEIFLGVREATRL